MRKLLLATCLACLAAKGRSAGQPALPKPAERETRIVVLAGELDRHRRGTHEYEKSALLLAHALQQVDGVRCSVHLGGWPRDARVLANADAIVVISSGGDQARPPHPLLVGNRMDELARQMQRGCGLAVIHWSTFVPNGAPGDRMLEWTGGYFDYQTEKPKRWRQRIRTGRAKTSLATPGHPIGRGVADLELDEEYYYGVRFRPNDPRLVPIVKARIAGVRGEHVVGWAVERKDGGRGFGYTGGHFYANYFRPGVRTLLCNAIVWCARREVPELGVQADEARKIRAMIVTGHNHPAHDWRATTAAIRDAVALEPRAAITVTDDVEHLAKLDRESHDVVILNYCNWQRGGLSQKAKQRFLSFVEGGGGLVVVHFANGAFHPSLPGVPQPRERAPGEAPTEVQARVFPADWPEFRKHLVRRVWDHAKGKSGHDRYGPMHVDVLRPEHPILGGASGWDTIDELYFRQQGDAPIEPLIQARSKITGKDEPLAWCYSVGKGAVFQTLLGHSAESLRNPGTARMLRRAVAWCAKRTPIDLPERMTLPLERGQFGQAFQPTRGRLEVRGAKRFGEPPLTVECWIKVRGERTFHVFASNELKTSASHWELYAYAGSGVLSAYLPGYEPSEIRSEQRITDNRWHHVAMTFDGEEVALFVDGKNVKVARVKPNANLRSIAGSVYLGGALHPSHEVGCRGLIDEVRISSMIREFDGKPRSRPELDGETLGMWRFDTHLRDASDRIETKAWTPVASKDRTAAPWVREKEEDWVDERVHDMDFGPALMSSIRTPKHTGSRITYKAIALRVQPQKTYLFDTQNVRFVGLFDGTVRQSPKRFGLLDMPRIDSKPILRLARRKRAEPFAPLPREQGRWLGHWRDGAATVLRYELAGVEIRERPRFDAATGSLVRQFSIVGHVPATTIPLLTVKNTPQGADGSGLASKSPLRIAGGELSCSSRRSRWTYDTASKTLGLRIPRLGTGETFSVVWTPTGARRPELENESIDPEAARADAGLVVETRGVRADDDAAYVVDTFTLPYENPDKALLFTSGIAVSRSGHVVVCTAHGDVWTGQPADSLARIRWSRFATGLYQPLGLQLTPRGVLVRGRDQITALRDRDGDFFADEYRCFSNLLEVSGQPHAYAMNLVRDSTGHLWSIKSGARNTRHGGSLLRITPDGKSIERFSFGYRHANGLGVTRDDRITTADNEGQWTPATRIDVAKRGGFYGYVPALRDGKDPNDDEKPLLWLPKEADNSAGSQIWTPQRWGPLGDKMLHLSYGRCRALLILQEKIGATRQAAAIDLPWKFLSGACRATVGADGHLYVCGLDGWQTAATHDGSVQRVRYTGQRFDIPIAFATHANGIVIEFSEPMRREAKIEDLQLERWNYRRSRVYGSDHWSVENPQRRGEDNLTIRRISFRGDGRALFVEVADMRPAMQLRLRYALDNDRGQRVTGRFWSTAHALREPFAGF